MRASQPESLPRSTFRWPSSHQCAGLTLWMARRGVGMLRVNGHLNWQEDHHAFLRARMVHTATSSPAGGARTQHSPSPGSYDASVRFLYSGYGRRRALRLWVPAAVIGILSVVTAQLSWVWVNRDRPIAERAGRVAEMGELDTAERLYWQILRSHPADLESWIRFIDVHAALQREADEEGLDTGETAPRPSVNESEIRAQLGRIGNAEASTLASYWYETEVTKKEAPVAVTAPTDTEHADIAPLANAAPAAVTALADKQPPAFFANYLLARAALKQGDWATAARRFEREGLIFTKKRQRLLRLAMSL